jgi:hypothetical protein
MSLLADIANGEVDTADLFFLFAVFLAVIAAGLYAALQPRVIRWAPVALSLSAACAWLALLVL